MKNTTFINGFTPSLHESCFNKAQRVGARKVKERYDACMHDMTGEEGPARLFASLLFGAMTRSEYANSKIRDAIAELREYKTIYRQDIKQLSNKIRKGVAKFDNKVVADIYIPGFVEFFDEISDSIEPQFDKLYLPLYFSVLQYTTALQIKYGEALAKLECAVALIDFSQKQFQKDVEVFRMKAPSIMAVADTFALPYAKLSVDLLRKVTDIAMRGRDEKIDLNDDKNVRTALDNLFRVLGNPDAMNNYLVVDPDKLPSLKEKFMK